jgi:hypothetical protein
VRIRLATEDDTSALVVMANAALEERSYRPLFGDGVDFAAVVPIFLKHWGVILLAEDPDPVGMFAATLLPHPISGIPYCDQWLWYVVPARRKGPVAHVLLSALEDLCLTRGITTLSLVSPVECPRLGASMTRRGYRAIEVRYVRDLTAGHDELSRQLRIGDVSRTAAPADRAGADAALQQGGRTSDV